MKAILGTIFKTILITATVAVTLVFIVIGLAALAHSDGPHSISAETSKPPLPVAVSFRKAFWGPGGVAIFKNISSQTLEVRAKVTTPTDTYTSFDLVIPSWGERQIGPLDGWSFVSGQRLELINSNYKSRRIEIQ